MRGIAVRQEGRSVLDEVEYDDSEPPAIGVVPAGVPWDDVQDHIKLAHNPLLVLRKAALSTSGSTGPALQWSSPGMMDHPSSCSECRATDHRGFRARPAWRMWAYTDGELRTTQRRWFETSTMAITGHSHCTVAKPSVDDLRIRTASGGSLVQTGARDLGSVPWTR